VSADPPTDHQSMGIDPYERNWIRFSVVLLVAFAATITLGGFVMGFEVPGSDEQVDPRTVLDSPPWSEPGVREIAPGVYEAYVVAQTWAFVPREITVPVDSEVTIHLTSPDVQHGFKVDETNLNMMVVPGQVSTLTYTFEELGRFPYICHEFCGRGHEAMFGEVNVVTAQEYEALTTEEASP
jgi:cytochrome c oxidase subunit 2